MSFEPGKPGTLRDVKEQELPLVPADRRGDVERALAYVRGWVRSLAALVAARPGELDCLLPCDLLFPYALDDETLRTEDEFAAAFADPSRVRHWIDESAREEARESLAAWGIEDQADAFLALRRPGIAFEDHVELEPDAVESSEADEEADGEADGEEPEWEEERAPWLPGATRFGGEPDLPASMPWPMSGGRPMTFAAQLDLDSLRGLAAAKELPQSGLLSFFYNAVPDRDFDKKIEYPTRVIHLATRDGLARRPTPPGGDRRPAFTAEPQGRKSTMPPVESPFYEALLPEERALAFRRSLVAAAKGEGSVVDPLPNLELFIQQWQDGDAEGEHRVLGYCHPHQGDPYLEAEVYATAGNWKTWEEGSVGAIRTARAARRWRLLLQLTAMVNGKLLLEQDCGCIYFLIPEDALAKQDWGQVRLVLQCS
ncbi:MAG: YwqG family protein [Myxococcales bacterium]